LRSSEAILLASICLNCLDVLSVVGTIVRVIVVVVHLDSRLVVNLRLLLL